MDRLKHKSFKVGLGLGILIILILFSVGYVITTNKSIDSDDVLYADHMLGEQNRILYSKDNITIYYLGIAEEDYLLVNDTYLTNPRIKILNTSNEPHTIVVPFIYINDEECIEHVNIEVKPNESIEFEIEQLNTKAVSKNMDRIKSIGLYLSDIPQSSIGDGFQAYLEI